MPGTDPPDRSFASVHHTDGIVVLGNAYLSWEGMGGREGVEHKEHLGGWGARTFRSEHRTEFTVCTANEHAPFESTEKACTPAENPLPRGLQGLQTIK